MFNISRGQNGETEPSVLTEAGNLAIPTPPEATNTFEPLLSSPERVEARTPNPNLLQSEKSLYKDPRCEEALKPGNCGDYVVRWYYDKQVNSCARFWFSGCNGSGNRFHSEKECQETCIKQ